MENKYYTPEISDLKVGYEFEEFTGTYKDQEDIEKVLDSNLWKKRVIETDDLKMWGMDPESEINDIVSSLERNRIRTPYLTKEQIEAEGWIHIGGKLSSYGSQIFEKISNTEGKLENNIKFELTYLKPTAYIPWIQISSNLHDKEENLYKGRCPSINEFRTICKLLNIK